MLLAQDTSLSQCLSPPRPVWGVTLYDALAPHPEERRNTPSRFMLPNRDKYHPDWPLGSNTDCTLYLNHSYGTVVEETDQSVCNDLLG